VTAELPAPAADAPRGRARWLLPIALSAAIATWQLGFNSVSPQPRRAYAMAASMGLSPDVPYFFYFYHHFGVFPVGAREVPNLGPSKRAAQEFVARHGRRLVMDLGWPVNTPRFGDYGKLFLLYPDVWLRGDPGHASAIPFNQLLFIGSLLAVFWSFWLEGQRRLGTLIVVLVGSNPFQIVETYGRGNVFSIPISVALLAVAALLPILSGRLAGGPRVWVTAIAGGAVLASFREVRIEAALMAAAVPAALLLARTTWVGRLALAAAFVAAFALTGLAWRSYWTAQLDRAERFVADAGGRVFRPPGGTHHATWHAIHCGLGDYGGDRGFSWDDRAAFRWATTRSATNPDPIPYRYVSGYYLEATHDGVHRVAPTDLPEYNRRVRDRVLDQIRREPLWYLGILLRRSLAILRDATPASLSAGPVTLAVPGAGWLLIPVLAFAAWRRHRLHAALILFTLPLSALALIVYSGRGMTFYGIAHLVALAVAIDLLARGWPIVRARPTHAA
jgi:hypothetical protein